MLIPAKREERVIRRSVDWIFRSAKMVDKEYEKLCFIWAKILLRVSMPKTM